ncbi:hypothetical protein [Vibrio harveyi]|uniref:hypothetical protein n=1 Tax=Vibrio harveyi TaxID=669 RepID=UPI003CED2DB5
MLKKLAGALALAMAVSPIATAKDTKFKISLTLLNPIEVQEVRSMNFGIVLGGFDSRVIISPHSPYAAIFKAKGIPYTNVNGSIVERETWLTREGIKGKAGKNDKILVNNFSFGGDMRPSGQAYFWHNGKLNNLRIGAQAAVSAENSSGIYTGTATFRLTYL